MPNTGDGTAWDEADPTDDELVSNMPTQDRDVRKGVRLRLAKEHSTPAGNSAGGEHKQGSAVAFIVADEAALPTLRPDGTTSLDADDEGRLALTLDTGLLYHYKDTDGVGTMAWTKVNANATFVQVAESYILLRHIASANSGTFTAGAWRKRTINQETNDAGAKCALDTSGASSDSQFTLVAGTYRFKIEAKAFSVDRHQARLRNITDSTSYLGTSAVAFAAADVAESSESSSVIVGRFTIGSTKTFEIQHWCESTKSTNGFGRRTDDMTSSGSVYLLAEFWREVG